MKVSRWGDATVVGRRHVEDVSKLMSPVKANQMVQTVKQIAPGVREEAARLQRGIGGRMGEKLSATAENAERSAAEAKQTATDKEWYGASGPGKAKIMWRNSGPGSKGALIGGGAVVGAVGAGEGIKQRNDRAPALPDYGFAKGDSLSMVAKKADEYTQAAGMTGAAGAGVGAGLMYAAHREKKESKYITDRFPNKPQQRAAEKLKYAGRLSRAGKITAGAGGALALGSVIAAAEQHRGKPKEKAPKPADTAPKQPLKHYRDIVSPSVDVSDEEKASWYQAAKEPKNHPKVYSGYSD